MNIDEIWRRLGAENGFPRDELQAALDNWDEASKRFISKLRAHAGGAKLADSDLFALFYVVHLCAEKHDERAYVPLCDILTRDGDIEFWLGDALTETLPGVLINLFDGDAEPLRAVIGAEEAAPDARCAALLALGYVVRGKQAMTDDEMRAYLFGLAAGLDRSGREAFNPAWVNVVGALGYDTMKAEVARVFSRGLVEPELADIKIYHSDLQRARASPDGLDAFRDALVEPFGSTIETLAGWSETAGEIKLGEAVGAVAEPYVNPLREVGRNDLCPCGSGKKYKKCCLAA